MSFPSFKSKDEIPEPFRAAYEERDGQWVAKLPDTTKLEDTLGKVRAEKKESERQAKEYAERAADLQRQLDAKAASGQDADKKVGELLDKWNKEKDEAVAKVAKERDEAVAKVRKLTLDDKVKAAAIKAEVLPELVEDVLNNTMARFDLDGERIIVKDGKGEVTTATVEDFFAKTYKAERPHYYAGSKAAGGGAAGSKGGIASSGADAVKLVLENPAEALRQANAKAA